MSLVGEIWSGSGVWCPCAGLTMRLCSSMSTMPKLFWTSAALPYHGPAHLAQPGFPLHKKLLLLMPGALFVCLTLSILPSFYVPLCQDWQLWMFVVLLVCLNNTCMDNYYMFSMFKDFSSASRYQDKTGCIHI